MLRLLLIVSGTWHRPAASARGVLPGGRTMQRRYAPRTRTCQGCGCCSGAAGERQASRRARPPHGELERPIEPQVAERLPRRVTRRPRPLVDLHDDVTDLEPGLLGGAAPSDDRDRRRARRRRRAAGSGRAPRRLAGRNRTRRRCVPRRPAAASPSSRTGTARRPSVRRTVRRTSPSTGARAISRWSSRVSRDRPPLERHDDVPGLIPARAAGVSSITSTITTPKPSRIPWRPASSSISCSLRSRIRTPSHDHAPRLRQPTPATAARTRASARSARQRRRSLAPALQLADERLEGRRPRG